MNIAEGLLILSALAGPVLAVQAQKWIERALETKNRRRNLFYALMATRAARVSFEHVRALNMIDIEFHARKDRDVIENWRTYLDHLNQPNVSDAELKAWGEKGETLFIDLLYAMSHSLGYDFDRVHLKRGVYSPRAHGEEELAQRDIRNSLVAILSGAKPFPIAVTSIQQTKEVLEKQQGLQGMLADVLAGKRPLQVAIQQAGSAGAQDK